MVKILLRVGLLCFILGFIIFLVINKNNNLPQPKSGYKWKLVFSDNFLGKSLDNNKWVTCYDWFNKEYDGCTNEGNNELEWYGPSQISVNNGILTLSAIKLPTVGLNKEGIQQLYPYQSGMISTGRPNLNAAPKEDFLYGYFEARIKVSSGKGIWPAFWLLPSNHSWPPEIDVMEVLGNNRNNVLLTYHWGNSINPQKNETIFKGLKNPNGWHTYAVNWQPGKITWYIDGVKQKNVESSNVPDIPMEVILNLAVGGDLPGNPDNNTHFPATVQVSYVHIYQQIVN